MAIRLAILEAVYGARQKCARADQKPTRQLSKQPDTTPPHSPHTPHTHLTRDQKLGGRVERAAIGPVGGQQREQRPRRVHDLRALVRHILGLDATLRARARCGTERDGTGRDGTGRNGAGRDRARPRKGEREIESE